MSSTDDADDQRAHNDEQPPPQNDTRGPTNEDEINGEPSGMLPAGISNTGHSQPSELHVEESTPNLNVAPDGDVALKWETDEDDEDDAEMDKDEVEKHEVEKDQPTLSELATVMKQVLDVLQDSTIASKTGKDHRSRFWGVYKRVAEEHDGEFLERYTSDMDIVLVFSGLFSAVSTSFIVAMESNLSPNPSDTTNALLTQLVQIGLGNLTAAGSAAAAPPSTWSPSPTTIWIQMIAYASLSMSLLAAFGAVLGKQWLGYYKSNRYGRGSQEERGKRRQETFDGIITWYFDAVVQSFPVLLQFSLLLFGIALSANMWTEQSSIAWVIISTTSFGFLFYSLTVMACLISPACPFQTPISTILRMLRIDRVLLWIFKPASRYFRQFMMSGHSVLQRLLGIVKLRWNRLSEASRGPIRAVGAFAWRSLQQLSTMLHKGLRSLVQHSSTKVVDSERQSLDQNQDVMVENECTLTLRLPHISTAGLEAPSIEWLLETSTDPEVFLAAAGLIPHVEWPLDLDMSAMLPLLYKNYTSCVDIQHRIVPSLKGKASVCIMALSHLYCGRVLQASPGYGELLGQQKRDYDVFFDMTKMGLGSAEDAVLSMTMKLCPPKDDDLGFTFHLERLKGCPDSVLEWLSHSLPCHFITERVDEDVKKLAIEVISTLLHSPSTPSNQIVANCTLLACMMIGVQFDKRDIVRVDKSSALPQLTKSLLTQFQKVLWAWDGGDVDENSTGVIRWAWNLFDVIWRILEPARCYNLDSSHTMQNLNMCRKIYSRARASEVIYPRDLFQALPNALHFTLAAANISRDPAQLWYVQSWGDFHSPEDFDWLVDYLGWLVDYLDHFDPDDYFIDPDDFIFYDDFIDSEGYQTAYEILWLLGGSEARCSPAKQHTFIETLIACMDSDKPYSLRHAALRAVHNVRQEMASIHEVDDANLRDMVVTKLSPAILTAACPRPGSTPPDGSLDHPFCYDYNSCYLELVCALASNSNWHSHLSGDHHIDRCISMIPNCYFGSPVLYLAGILLRIPPEQWSATSLDSITEQEWWHVTSNAWAEPYDMINDTHFFKLLPAIAEGTKKYMHFASALELKQVIRSVDYTLETLERRDSEQGEQGEGVAVAFKELRTVASNMLERMVNSDEVVSP